MIASRLTRMGGAVAKRKRDDVTVKLDAELVRIAKVVAAYRDITIAEYLSERLRPLVDLDHIEEMQKHSPGLLSDDRKKK